ncbi:hypothetical protein DES39_0492 [Orbus hercynius]|uniref:Uncharacterized protein n=1 Tax=Orbus hercynius TaxID=593135 RepID=A0A495RIC3_9GAMM|nr:hypothetical protein [Orbus hercynius]RKS87272.1 hypothetical protein DES39_0492 [Orbus hercynius]
MEFHKLLDLISEGIKSFVLVDDMQSGHNVPWFLSRTVNKATSRIHVEKKIHTLIDQVAKLLNIELFIIAIDDVDTQTEKAYEILEAIRCYLTHPRLAIIISGDLKLYSYIVRNKKNDELSTKDDINKTQKNTLITHLEQQYLSKVFPIEQRIALKKMDELVSKSSIIYIKHAYLSDNLTDNEIRQLLTAIFMQSLDIKKEYLISYIKFILNQPIRSIFQFIKTMIEGMQNGRFTSKALEQSLYHIFVGEIIDEGVNVDSLSAYDINPIGYELCKLIFQHNDFETGFYARPDSSKGQNSYNAAKLYLSASAMNLNNELSHLLKLMLIVGASAHIYTNCVKNSGQEGCNTERYIDYIGLNHNNRITSIAARFSPIILESYSISTHHKAISGDVVRTYRQINARTFDVSTFETLLQKRIANNFKCINTLQGLSKKLAPNSPLDLYHYTSVMTITMAAHHAVTAVERRDYISVYKLIAAIAELLSEGTAKIADLMTLKNYDYPNFFSGKIKGHTEFVDDERDEFDSVIYIATANSPHEMVRLIALLRTWIDNSIAINIKTPMLLSGKIWTRIFYSLSIIAENAKVKQPLNGITKNYQKYDTFIG